MKPIRVLVVDDSATMRSLIREMLLRDPAIEVAGEAGDALEARTAIKALNPDVITLDVEMPKMNGLEFLDKIMRLRPAPVIMVFERDRQRCLRRDQGTRNRGFRLRRQTGAGRGRCFRPGID